MTETRNTDDIWDGVLHDRIDHIGRAPSPQQYSNAISIEALDKGKQIIEDAMQDAPEALSEHVERKEHAVAQSIVTIHHHHNLVPVMRLPPEILSQIFVLHARIDLRDWLNAVLTSTHVCRRWWQIGRTCPELWSYIDSRHSTALMAWMIEHSGTVPLSLRATGYHLDQDTSRLISSNLHRFESLDLSVPSVGADTFVEAFNQPAPLLQQVTLDISYDRDFASPPDFAFPPEFLGGSPPNLRHMKLTAWRCVPWDSGLFTRLVTLDVSGSSSGSPSPLGALLCALARMPELETLILRHCLSSPKPSATTGTHVDLSNLKRLEVEDFMKCCTRFFRKIATNPNATVLLNIKRSGVTREDIKDFFTVFLSYLYTASTPVVRALKFMRRDSHEFKIDMWTVQQNTEIKTSQNASIKLISNSRSIYPHLVSSPDLNLMRASFMALASPQLRSFRLSGSNITGWDAEVWRELARAAPNLRRLVAEAKAQGAELLKALSPPDVPDLVLADCPFPALSYLELRPPYLHRMPTPDRGESPLSAIFARSLVIRASVGCLTPELVFISSPRNVGYSKGWFDPFDAVPGLTMHVKEWWRELEMVRMAVYLFASY